MIFEYNLKVTEGEGAADCMQTKVIEVIRI
jgi:hypothetical protein